MNCLNKQHRKHAPWFLAVFGMLVFCLVLLSPSARAQDVGSIRNQIQDRNERIGELEREIRKYEAELQEIGTEKKTLQSAITSLDVSRQKIGTDINLTENRIGAANLTIQELALGITEKELAIAKHQGAIAKSLRSINEIENDSLVETVLAHDDLNEVWERVESLERFQSAVRNDIEELAVLRDRLTEQKLESEGKKQELVAFRNQLSGQKRVLDENRREKNALLAQTENKEDNYQALLQQKQAEKDRFERELRDLESQLEFALDPTKIPAAEKGVLAWPIDNVHVTQYFGNTKFAQSGAYNGNGHNGIDFRASPGTSIRAALSGEVIATNNQVAYQCQYGKWVLIRHFNGLTTLYAHLSVVPEHIHKGKRVTTGEIIGYSGNTGYAIGPHLHFTVYASDAVQFKQYTCNSGATLTIPIAAYSGYLNPLDYLGSE